MPHALPVDRINGSSPELAKLLRAADEHLPEARNAAWEDFVEKHSRLLLHVVHSRSRSYDAAMNQFVYVLEKLREDEYRRLRAYAPDGRAAFPTWLVVVAQRLCIDYERQRYGRVTQDSGRQNPQVAARRSLVDLVLERLDLNGYWDPKQASPDLSIRTTELQTALAGATRALEHRDRLLLRLRFEKDLPAREIARLMDFPSLFHVYRRLKIVLKQLREALLAQGVEDSKP